MAEKTLIGDRDELMGLLWTAARKGNVPAMRILLEDMEKTPDAQEERKSVIDQLAEARKRRSG